MKRIVAKISMIEKKGNRNLLIDLLLIVQAENVQYIGKSVEKNRGIELIFPTARYTNINTAKYMWYGNSLLALRDERSLRINKEDEAATPNKIVGIIMLDSTGSNLININKLFIFEISKIISPKANLLQPCSAEINIL